MRVVDYGTVEENLRNIR